ncbi:hypothetical protein QYE76_039757 [Lolium multiflorum]|uniref:Uncharacterized protein n=1 Tax=Lolium multiflorum TaxID=4521 RepID=A0AAD8TAA5_LOLMU|nr:hypothetical protein QYE76_039757 [Lolium multiflorum]
MVGRPVLGNVAEIVRLAPVQASTGPTGWAVERSGSCWRPAWGSGRVLDRADLLLLLSRIPPAPPSRVHEISSCPAPCPLHVHLHVHLLLSSSCDARLLLIPDDTQVHLQLVMTEVVVSCSVELWEIILHGYREPQDPIRLTSTEFYNRQLNASARDKIRSGINRKLLDQVNDIGSAKELWDRIVVLQEGTDLIQSSLYETTKQEAHRFMIREGESVADAYARLGALRVRIKGLGVEKYDDDFEMNEGFIKSKVIAMIAVKQEDTNLALNLQIMTKSADQLR